MASALLLGMHRFASGVGLVPEQDWELPDLAASPFGTDPTVASIGFENGRPAGSSTARYASGVNPQESITGDLYLPRG